MESALTTKGQATIPKLAREHLGVKSGDRLKFFLNPDGTVVILPKRPAAALRGMLKSRRHVSVDQMNEAIKSGAAARHRKR